MPLRHGGRGLISASLVAPAAFFASAAETALAFVDHRGHPVLHDDALWDTPIGQSILAAHDSLATILNRFADRNERTALAVAAFFPANGRDFFTFYGSETWYKLQSRIMSFVHRWRREQSASLCDRKDSARLLSCSAPGASLAATSVPDPQTPSTSMTNEVVATYTALVLGRLRHTPTARRCRCSHASLSNGEEHFLVCRSMSGAWWQRHDLIVRELMEWCRKAGCQVDYEPQPWWETDNKRPDLTIYSPEGVFQLDASVTHPAASSFVFVDIAQRRLGAAKAREAVKRRHYEDRCLPGFFIPFVLETYGAFGPAATEFMKRIARWADNLSGVDAAVFYARMRTAISSSLARGNALVVFRGRARPPVHVR